MFVGFADDGAFEDMDVTIGSGFVDDGEVDDMDASIIVGLVEGNCVR